ncbi:MAG: AAA family ATPase [Nanoarchaeota archaeon]|nr:AAA family ATPase [Nanoarchaeota archaeon]MBU1102972.1 AAA family ATPase [Nanoarchaeota archaeon]
MDETGEKQRPKKKKEDMMMEAKGFFNSCRKEIGESIRREEGIVRLDFEQLVAFSPVLAENVLELPEETVAILELALEESGLVANPRVRLVELPKSCNVMVRAIRARHLDRLVAVEGIVRQASEVRPQVVNARFECPNCGAILSVLQIERKFREPSRCSCGWKGNFKLLSKEMVDVQKLVVEESPDTLEGGEQPRRINVFLKEDLVDVKMEKKTTPGSRVKIYGILKEVAMPLQTGSISTRFDIALEANNTISMEETFDELEMSDEDVTQIQELAADPNIFKRLSESIAPSIYGYSQIKQAVLLQLFSGVKKKKSDGGMTRGDIHVLLVGDPGVAKSVLLKYASTIAPKGRYVSGKSATAAGLTAAVVKDEFLRGWSLEGGAMVLSNKGVVCIDEIEKMEEHDRSTMHEAMEQQCYLPDFEITLSDGSKQKIGKLVDNLMEKNKDRIMNGRDCEILPVEDLELLSTDFSNIFSLKASKVSRHIASKEFVKIVLTNGRELTVTPEHPCWVTNEGKIFTVPAVKLKEGMYFPIPSKTEFKTEDYEKKNDYLCKVLGYHISDGCYELNKGKKTGIQFWNNDEILIKDYNIAVEKYFNVKPKIVRRKHQFASRVISKKVFEQMMELDESLLEKGDVKKIPEKIMGLPNENIKYLLRALYDGDGSVIFQQRNGCRISFVSQNRALVEQVSDLLLRFGIQSSIFIDSHSKVWRLDISGQENLRSFLMEISFLSTKKKERLKKYLELKKTYRTIKDIIPGCTDLISGIYKKLGISMNKELGHSIDLHVEKQRKHLRKLVLIAEQKMAGKNICDSKIKKDLLRIKKLAFGSSRWMKIKSVEKVKNPRIKYVYDVTVEPTHSFISNGMVLHNSVTVAKANIHATLRAETTVLAAGNPKLGRFDPYTPIPQQIDISPALLTRFDVLFVIRDLPNKKQDEAVATHVLEEHKQGVVRDVVDSKLLRKYIAYARQRIKPKLTDEAIEEIKRFYLKLRGQPGRSDSEIKPIPITARQLEGLVRLSEAHAKMRLSEEVKSEDARVAIDLLKFSLMQVGYDEETKSFDVDRITTGITSSKRGKILLVKEILSQLESRLGKLIPVEELEKAVEGKMTKTELDDAVDQLSKSGDIFKPRKGYLQRL